MSTSTETRGGHWAKTVAVGAIGAVIAGVLTFAVANASFSPSSANAAPGLDDTESRALEAVSGKFTQPQTKADQLPDHLVDNGVESFIATTARNLGATPKAKFWVVANEEGDACLALATPDGWGAATCQPPDFVLENGLSVQLIDVDKADGGTRAILLPRDYEIATGSEALTEVGDQLLVGRADAPGDVVSLKATDGSTVVIDDLQAVK